MKKSLLSLVFSLAIFTLLVFVGSWVRAASQQLLAVSDHRGSEVEQVLRVFANNINKLTPRTSDNGWRLDNVFSGPGSSLTWNYTILDRSIDNIDKNEFMPAVRKMLVGYVKASGNLKLLRDHRVTMNYHYRDRDGVPIGTLTISSEDYAP